MSAPLCRHRAINASGADGSPIVCTNTGGPTASLAWWNGVISEVQDAGALTKTTQPKRAELVSGSQRIDAAAGLSKASASTRLLWRQRARFAQKAALPSLPFEVRPGSAAAPDYSVIAKAKSLDAD